MRRFLLATVGLCVALSASAGTVNKSQTQVVVPDTSAGFEFGVTGAYLRADYSQVDYVLQDSNMGNHIPDGRFIDSESDRDWGWGLMLGYRFGCMSGFDARVHYFTFTADDDSAITAPNLYRSTGVDDSHAFWTGGPADDDDDTINYLTSARSHNAFDLTAIDLEFAQNINVGCYTSLRFFVGLSHHDIERETTIHYQGERPDIWAVDDDSITEPLSETVVKHSEFQGWGPRVGMDMAYAFNNGFGIVGHFSSAFFFGDVDVKTHVTRVDEHSMLTMEILDALNGDVHTHAGVSVNSRHIVVPNMDLRLGIDYSHCFCNGTVLTAELGYWGRGYLGAVGDIHLDDSKHITQFDNVVYHGAYLTLRAQL